MGEANSCSYSNFAIQPIFNALINAQKTIFEEIFYFRRYRDDCIITWNGDADKVNLLLQFFRQIVMLFRFEKYY